MTSHSDLLQGYLISPGGGQAREQALKLLNEWAEGISAIPVSGSLRRAEGGMLAMAEKKETGENLVLAFTLKTDTPAWFDFFTGERIASSGMVVLIAPCTPGNSPAVQRALPNLKPAPIGLSPSFGFGDRIGLASPGHAAAMKQFGQGLVPIFAQQSIREMTRSHRTPADVMADATFGAFRAGWRGPVGADADHLKTAGDVDGMAKAGFTFFTIDPSDHVDREADHYSEARVEERFQILLNERVTGVRDIMTRYAGRSYDLESDTLVFTGSMLKRAAVKYGRALAHICALNDHAKKIMAGRDFELEISVDETEQPTTVLEHLYLALELKRHGVSFVSLAPRFVGEFEKGIDYRGDKGLFESELIRHAAVARQYGPYKLSLHSGSDKFGVYPMVGRITRQRFHVKTAGTSYLEALRVACRSDPGFFKEVAVFSRGCFEEDRATYHISAALESSPDPIGLTSGGLEKSYLDEDNGRQILHVTYGSVLTARETGGEYRFRDHLKKLLQAHHQEHEQVLIAHLGRHLNLLTGREGE